MPARLEKLQDLIRELETELGSLDTLDASTRQALETTVGEIQAALAGHPSPADAGDDSLQQRLQGSLQEFEASHPGLASLLSRVIDLLGQIGI
ncbi:MAG: DUF4404 family protein [Pirellulaceae bacterium]|nr:DUF4404 family protein [Pirellulaceae bacterium]